MPPRFKDPSDERISIAFMSCIVLAMLAGFMAWRHVSLVSWLLAVNLAHVSVVMHGELRWQGGGLLVSRDKNPAGFWCFLFLSFLFFNGLGLLLLLF